jgi:hypothetical protein
MDRLLPWKISGGVISSPPAIGVWIEAKPSSRSV